MSDARERIAEAIRMIAPNETDRILQAVFSEVVAGATVEEMSRAMGHFRAEQIKPTYAAMGEYIWQLRYDRATEEGNQYDAAFGQPQEDDGE